MMRYSLNTTPLPSALADGIEMLPYLLALAEQAIQLLGLKHQDPSDNIHIRWLKPNGNKRLMTNPLPVALSFG